MDRRVCRGAERPAPSAAAGQPCLAQLMGCRCSGGQPEAVAEPPKPDVANSGVRGVFMDRWENAWVARWNDCGLNKYSMFKINTLGFEQSFKAAVATRLRKTKETHRFVFQRFRWKGKSKRYGTART